MTILTGELHKLVFGGSLATTESWACAINMMTDGVETANDADSVSLFAQPLIDWVARNTSMINQSARLEYVKLNQINKVDGLYLDGGNAVTFFLPVVGIPHAQAHNAPPQLSQCVTWHTDVIRGRASHGRIYPPTTPETAMVTGTGSNGQMSIPDTQAMADSAQELVSELNNVTSNLTAVVWSQIGQVGRTVDRVSVGRVVDTQQRRRKSVSEARVFAIASV